MSTKSVLLLLAVCGVLGGCAWGRGPEGCPTTGYTSLNPGEYKLKEAFHVAEKGIGD